MQTFLVGILFASEAGVYPSKTPFRCSTLGLAPGKAHKQKTTEMAFQEQTLKLVKKFVTYGRKSFIILAPDGFKNYKKLCFRSSTMKPNLTYPLPFLALFNVTLPLLA